MGAKRLKAVVVRGSRDVGIADPKRFKAALDAYRETLEGELWTETLRRLGTPNLVTHRQKLGIWGAKNFQRGTIEGWEKISGETFREKFLHKVLGCMGCLVRAGDFRCPRGTRHTKGRIRHDQRLGAKPYITDPAVSCETHLSR
jgi:aldehyde:ferredoxin oxidoreductase